MDKKIEKNFPTKITNTNALKLLLINISTHFTKDKGVSEYDVLEPPLGLIALQTYLNQKLGKKFTEKLLNQELILIAIMNSVKLLRSLILT